MRKLAVLAVLCGAATLLVGAGSRSDDSGLRIAFISRGLLAPAPRGAVPGLGPRPRTEAAADELMATHGHGEAQRVPAFALRFRGATGLIHPTVSPRGTLAFAATVLGEDAHDVSWRLYRLSDDASAARIEIPAPESPWPYDDLSP